jgi:truncated hemoglobin YjbI
MSRNVAFSTTINQDSKYSEHLSGGDDRIRLGQLEKWDAFLGNFQRALDGTAVPAEEQAELKAVANSTRSHIVVASGAAVA